MHKDIRPIILLDEAESLFRVEPFYFSLWHILLFCILAKKDVSANRETPDCVVGTSPTRIQKDNTVDDRLKDYAV